MSWFLHNVPPKRSWFLGFRPDGRKLRNFFVLTLPTGIDVNVWIPEGSSVGSEVLVKVACHPAAIEEHKAGGTAENEHNNNNKKKKPQRRLSLNSMELVGRMKAKVVKKNYHALQWTDLHLLCIERGLKPFGSRRDLAVRLQKFDKQTSVRNTIKSAKGSAIQRIFNEQALSVVAVNTLRMRELPAYYADPTRYKRMPYESVWSLAAKHEVTSRRAPKKELVERLVHAKRVVDSVYAELLQRYLDNDVQAVVNVPRSETPSDSGLVRESQETKTSTISSDLPEFQDIDVDGNGTISAEELQLALTKDGEVSFHLRTCQLLISMVDMDNDGEIDRFEFPGLLSYLSEWEHTFESYDKDNSGTIDMDELKVALHANGFKLSDAFFNLVVTNYNWSGNLALHLDGFIQVFCELTALTRIFMTHTPSHSIAQKAQFSLPELISKCKPFTSEQRLAEAFNSNERKDKLGFAEFDYERFLYHCVAK